VLSSAIYRRLYRCMGPTAASGFIAAGIQNGATEIADFDEVVRRYRTRILRFVLASVRDADAAETLTQECFWRAYRGRSGFRGDASVHTWLVRIATNVVRDHLRSRRLRFWRRAERNGVDSAAMADWLPDPSLTPEQRALVQEQVREVWEATGRLPHRQRTVFLLRFVEDMEISDIASATGLTCNAVNVHLFRAVRAIRKHAGRTR
jgi:RNA polymerase sigma-70 factor (ECF subfamily)